MSTIQIEFILFIILSFIISGLLKPKENYLSNWVYFLKEFVNKIVLNKNIKWT